MKNKKLNLGDLKIKSFVTTVSDEKVKTVKGGGTVLPYCQPTWDCPSCPPHGCDNTHTVAHQGCDGGTFMICGDTNPNCTVKTCLGEA